MVKALIKNEILAALNKLDDYILAIVEVAIEEIDGKVKAIPSLPRYIRRPFQKEPDFAATSVNFNLLKLLAESEDAQ